MSSPGAAPERIAQYVARRRPASSAASSHPVNVESVKASKQTSKSANAPLDPEASSFRLRLGRSSIQGRGLFAEEHLPRGRKIIEYTGERISMAGMTTRIAWILKERGPLPRYVFRLNPHWFIDGETGGCGAEFVNHSCDPNLATRRIRGHILYFSKRNIRKGEELTVDYRFRPDSPRTECHCGSPGCRGIINLTAEQWKRIRKHKSRRRPQRRRS